MQRIASKMKLFKGCEEEYKRRHDLIWPELQQLLKQTGIHEYSIFLDTATNDLFAFLKLEAGRTTEDLPNHPIMQKWWSYMGDIMETNPDSSPVSTSLEEVFFLP